MKPIKQKTPRRMNRTEQEHADHLQRLKIAGAIIDYRYEPFSLRLANNTFYIPDFLVVCADHFEIHEIKGGFVREDARAKVKIAAEAFPWWTFHVFQKVGRGVRAIWKKEDL